MATLATMANMSFSDTLLRGERLACTLDKLEAEYFDLTVIFHKSTPPDGEIKTVSKAEDLLKTWITKHVDRDAGKLFTLRDEEPNLGQVLVWNRISSRLPCIQNTDVFRWPRLSGHTHFKIDQNVAIFVPEHIIDIIDVDGCRNDLGIPDEMPAEFGDTARALPATRSAQSNTAMSRPSSRGSRSSSESTVRPGGPTTLDSQRAWHSMLREGSGPGCPVCPLIREANIKARLSGVSYKEIHRINTPSMTKLKNIANTLARGVEHSAAVMEFYRQPRLGVVWPSQEDCLINIMSELQEIYDWEGDEKGGTPFADMTNRRMKPEEHSIGSNENEVGEGDENRRPERLATTVTPTTPAPTAMPAPSRHWGQPLLRFFR
ncbi:hypothetical protein F5Y15DRAFT_389642 [Xylariaceae sp. FL0016]|nr:hypothetical protein F5Y15DRAFT_389642 [Xylariaceae sp. FL0016]